MQMGRNAFSNAKRVILVRRVHALYIHIHKNDSRSTQADVMVTSNKIVCIKNYKLKKDIIFKKHRR